MDRNFVAQLNDYRITTAEILYWMPDHKHVLQSFVWQNLDLAPRFPNLTKFLDFWEKQARRQAAPGAGGERPADQARRVQFRLRHLPPALTAGGLASGYGGTQRRAVAGPRAPDTVGTPSRRAAAIMPSKNPLRPPCRVSTR